jgi:DNA-binding CsgD family transcriptional regulator
MVTFQRGEEHGPFTVEEEGRFTQVSKYLSKAVELRVKISGQDKNDLRLKSVLNKLRLPVTAVNEFGDIVAHNDAMLGFLQSQDALIIEGSHLALFNDGYNKKLKHAIVKSVAQSKDFESSVDSDSSIITVNKGGNSFVIGTCELSDKTAGTDQFSGALLYVVSPDLLKPISAEQLQRIFLFTNAESVVCSLFAQNMSLKEIAIQENKSVNTVREQLQNCYVKTHTKNQLELVNLLSGLPSEG